MKITKQMFLEFMDRHKLNREQAAIIMGITEDCLNLIVQRDKFPDYQKELAFLFKAFGGYSNLEL